LPAHENQNEDKRVESIFVPCLDEGSTPSSSTKSADFQQLAKSKKFTLIRVRGHIRFRPRDGNVKGGAMPANHL